MPTFDNATPPNRNAVRHGLTGEQPLDLDESRRLAELTAMWARKLGVADMAERLVAHRIAVSIIKLDRCEAADQAAVGPNVEAALNRWNRQRRHAIRPRARAGGRPGRHRHVAAGLGIRLRLAAWRQIRAPRRRPEPGARARRCWRCGCSAAAPIGLGRRPGRPRRRRGHAPLGSAGPPRRSSRWPIGRRSPGWSSPGEGWQQVEGPEEAAVIANARVDTSDQGRLRHRYAQDAERAMSRNLDFLLKLRKVERRRAAAARPRPPRSGRRRVRRPRRPVRRRRRTPSRNEPRSAAQPTGKPGPISMPGKTLSEAVPAEPISIPRRPRPPRPAPRGAPRAPPGPLPAHRTAAGPPSSRPNGTARRQHA